MITKQYKIHGKQHIKPGIFILIKDIVHNGSILSTSAVEIGIYKLLHSYTYFYHGFNLKAITTGIILITALHESTVIF